MASRKILIVEDDPDLAMLLCDSLAREEYGCKVAADAVQAMTLARQYKPDLVLLDFMLPGGGGPAVHKALRSETAGAWVPVILLTCVPEEKVRSSLDMDGQTYFLSKPYRREDLMQVLQQALLDHDERRAP